jgi:cysteine desulfurase/selenocysteine lyase
MSAALTNEEAECLRADFPVLQRDPSYVYLDSGATTLAPQQVIDGIAQYYSDYCANVHRSGYRRALETTQRIQRVREAAAAFIGASSDEIVFTKNASDGLGLVMNGLHLSGVFEKRRRVLVSTSEHHSNLLPWMLLAERGVELEFVALRPDGAPDLEDLARRLARGHCGAVCIGHASNVTGNIADVGTVAALASAAGAFLVVDGTQAVPHLPVNVSVLGADFYAFSAHKMLGPTGLGVLFAARHRQKALKHVTLGGGTVSSATTRGFDTLEFPHAFEVGTPNTAAIFGFECALEYLRKVSLDRWRARELHLVRLLLDGLRSIPGVRVYGSTSAEGRVGTVAFNVDGADCDEVATILEGKHGIAIRAGLHCAQPLVDALSAGAGVCRASLYVYNTDEEVIALIGAVERIAHAFH